MSSTSIKLPMSPSGSTLSIADIEYDEWEDNVVSTQFRDRLGTAKGYLKSDDILAIASINICMLLGSSEPCDPNLLSDLVKELQKEN